MTENNYLLLVLQKRSIYLEILALIKTESCFSAELCLMCVNSLLSAKPMMRCLVVAISVFCDYIAFFLIFLNFTNDSIFSSTNETSIINSRYDIVLENVLGHFKLQVCMCFLVINTHFRYIFKQKHNKLNQGSKL